MRLVAAALIAVATLTGAGEVQAAHHRHHHFGRVYDSGSIVSHPAGCPHSAFCGCGASARVFGHPVRELYLAANWFKFPRTQWAPGVAGVRRHHVFIVEQVVGNGRVLAYDANSGGHATRVHVISTAGYTPVQPRG